MLNSGLKAFFFNLLCPCPGETLCTTGSEKSALQKTVRAEAYKKINRISSSCMCILFLYCVFYQYFYVFFTLTCFHLAPGQAPHKKSYVGELSGFALKLPKTNLEPWILNLIQLRIQLVRAQAGLAVSIINTFRCVYVYLCIYYLVLQCFRE